MKGDKKVGQDASRLFLHLVLEAEEAMSVPKKSVERIMPLQYQICGMLTFAACEGYGMTPFKATLSNHLTGRVTDRIIRIIEEFEVETEMAE